MEDSSSRLATGVGPEQPDESVRLKVCDLDSCEARCCYDGVYLQDGEEEMIRTVVLQNREFFRQLPAEFIVDGAWGDSISGRKTATVPHEYKRADYPAHFAKTRCVFCNPQHLCLLQLLSVERGLHKWAYKPEACWMFPLRTGKSDEPVPPPLLRENDPDSLGEKYPGYMTYVPCGQHTTEAGSLPWKEALAEEIEFHRELGEDANRG